MPKKDFSQVASHVEAQAVRETTEIGLTARQRNSRKGGLKGGASRAAMLTPEQRTQIARTAAKARWNKST
jgi:hypothetical protein